MTSNQFRKSSSIEKLAFLEKMIRIGFCQPKFYKRSVWVKARNIMEYAIKNGAYVQYHDFGRGKGKFVVTNEFRKVIYINNYDFEKQIKIIAFSCLDIQKF